MMKAPTGRPEDCCQRLGSSDSAENCRVECKDGQSESEKFVTTAIELKDQRGEPGTGVCIGSTRLHASEAESPGDQLAAMDDWQTCCVCVTATVCKAIRREVG